MPFLIPLAIGLIAGLAGTKVMELFTTWMYGVTPEAEKRREREVQSRASFVVAAERTMRLVGVRLGEADAQRMGTAFHWALGITFGVVYWVAWLLSGWDPIALGLAVGLFMFVVIDEAANAVFGFAAPPQRFPLWTHARGLFGHIVYGLTVALVANLIFRMIFVS